MSQLLCFRCSKEPSREGSFEYPQHMFWLRNEKTIFCYALLTKGLNMSIALSDNIFTCVKMDRLIKLI